MASACVNNNVSLPPSYGCFSPRISFSRDFPPRNGSDPAEDANADPDLGSSKDFIDFEFNLNDPVAMLPADELFSDGKLVPLHLAPLKPAPAAATDETRLPPGAPLKPAARREELIGSWPECFAVSPKAPTCSSRWRELLRLKRQQQEAKPDPGSKNNPNPKSLKQFLNRNLRSSSSSDPNLSLQLPRDSEPEPEPLSISSRLSLSSTSSSGHEAEDLPRLSLATENKPNQNPILLNRNPPKVRVSSSRARSGDGRVSIRAGQSPVRRPTETAPPPPRCASVDSPRMNASGKVVFQGLGRSSSSPSTFNGGPRIKHRGMERSYSANVRVTPVLNVPVCSLRGGSKSFGFGQLFSGSGSGSSSKNGSGGSSTSKGKN